MKSLLIASLGFALATSALAVPVTFNDPFPGSAFPATCGGNAQLCDVIGDASKFDIQKITGNVSTTAGNNSTFTIFTNWVGGTSSLSPTNYAGATLHIGDLLFYLGGNVQFGVALTAHGGLLAGGLYSVTNTISSDTMMSGVNATYRTGKPVWIDPNGASLLGNGTINVTGPSGNPAFQIAITIPTPQSLATFFGDAWGISFASATCANDILEGSLTTPLNEVPEPSTYFMMGAGLLGLGFLRRKALR